DHGTPRRRKQTTTNVIEQTKLAKQTNKETKTTRDHQPRPRRDTTLRNKKKSWLHTKNVEQNLEERNQTTNRSQKRHKQREKKEGAPSRRHTHLKRTDCKRHRGAHNTGEEQ
uniref:Uncharacterized protein n=2 Tax=Ixodes scapularis TaxID=6945 RepID=A0A1S4LG71_IXOSC